MMEFFTTAPGALSLALGLTLLVAWESIFAPWAPFFWIYALLAISLPVALGHVPFGSFQDVFRCSRHMLIAGGLMVAWEIGLFHWIYEMVFLRRIGRGRDPSFSVPAAIGDLLQRAEKLTGVPEKYSTLIFAAYTLVWAPLGEEVFYWGYLQNTLRPHYGFALAASLAAVFFAFRHAVHFLYLRGNLPWRPALALSLSAFGSGCVNGWLFEKTGCLTPLIVLHLAMNGLWLATLRLSGHMRARTH